MLIVTVINLRNNSDLTATTILNTPHDGHFVIFRELHRDNLATNIVTVLTRHSSILRRLRYTIVRFHVFLTNMLQQFSLNKCK